MYCSNTYLVKALNDQDKNRTKLMEKIVVTSDKNIIWIASSPNHEQKRNKSHDTIFIWCVNSKKYEYGWIWKFNFMKHDLLNK